MRTSGNIAGEGGGLGMAPVLRGMGAFPMALATSYLGSQLLVAAVVAPLASLLVAWLVRATGQVVVANEALVGFFLSPAGLIALLVALVAAVMGVELARASAALVM